MVTLLLLFFLAVLGALATRRFALQFHKSWLSTKYNLPKTITYVASLKSMCCSACMVSEIIKMGIHSRVSPNALFLMHVLLGNRNSGGKPLN